MYNGERDVVAKHGDELAVVDARTDMWGRMRFTAGVIKTKMVPKTWCEKVGTYGSEAEARDAAKAALTAPDSRGYHDCSECGDGKRDCTCGGPSLPNGTREGAT